MTADETIELEVEPVTAPYSPCYYIVHAGKVFGVLYWDDDDPSGELPPGTATGWCFFLASTPQHHDVLGRAEPPSQDVAIAEAKDRVSAYLRATDEQDRRSLADLEPSKLPWRLVMEDEGDDLSD